jgi:hypothetical protein
MLLAACIKPCAIIARRSDSSSRGLLNFSCPADLANYYSAGPAERSGGAMTFYDHTLYGRDDEMDEFGDSGAFSESLEEDLEEEDEEEEEARTPEPDLGRPEPPSVPAAPAPKPAPAGGGGGARKPAAKKKAAKKAKKKAKKGGRRR